MTSSEPLLNPSHGGLGERWGSGSAGATLGLPGPRSRASLGGASVPSLPVEGDPPPGYLRTMGEALLVPFSLGSEVAHVALGP